jgi:hypothetical protein
MKEVKEEENKEDQEEQDTSRRELNWDSNCHIRDILLSLVLLEVLYTKRDNYLNEHKISSSLQSIKIFMKQYKHLTNKNLKNMTDSNVQDIGISR